jgi:hypothetical protein
VDSFTELGTHELIDKIYASYQSDGAMNPDWVYSGGVCLLASLHRSIELLRIAIRSTDPAIFSIPRKRCYSFRATGYPTHGEIALSSWMEELARTPSRASSDRHDERRSPRFYLSDCRYLLPRYIVPGFTPEYLLFLRST